MKVKNSNRRSARFLTASGLILALLVAAGLPMSAAVINFKSPVTCFGDTDVLTIGQGLFSYEYGAAATVNGVAFSQATSFSSVGGGNLGFATFNSFSANTFAGTNAPYTNLTAAYKNLLVGGVYVTNSGPSTVGTVTLSGLNPGHNYAVQMWANDSRGTFSNRNEYIYGGSGGATNLLVYNVALTNGGLGQYIIGNFTADNNYQSFLFDSGTTNVLPQMNAVQIRDVSSVWSGTTSGNWADSDTTSANFSGLNYSTVLGYGLTNVYFGDADAYGNAAARTTITVGVGGASTLNAVFQNKAVAYTLNSADANGIKGTVNVALNGTNTVTFTGAHTYTGSTVLGSNARLTIGSSGSIADSTNILLGANSILTLGNSTALAGAFAISLASGSILDASSSSLQVGSSQTLSGSGAVKGNVTAASGATLVPGTLGNIATLTFSNNLTLNGQAFTFDVGPTPNGPSDKIAVAGTLTLNGDSVIALNIPGGTIVNGTYTLMTFTSKSGGTLTLDQSYPGVTLNVNSTSVTLTVTGGIVAGGTSGIWTNLASGNWTTAANWQGGVIATNLDALADFSTLLMTANTSVTVASTNITVGNMVFGDVGKAFGSTLTGGTNTLAVSGGSPKIVVNSGTVTINSVLAGSQGFTKLGTGTLNLGGANKITNGVNVLGGTVNITAAGALSGPSVSSLNPVVFSNAVFQFTTSGAQFFTNDIYLLGTSNTIVQSSAAQDNFVGKITGAGILRVSAPGGVVIGQRGDMSGFTGTVLVTGSAAGNNAAGLLLANGDATGISGSPNATFDFEGGTLNYLYSGSPTATNYLGALVGNNANAILQAKNGAGTTTGDLTVEVGALNTDTAFAGKFRDYANVNTGTAPPKLGIRKVGIGALTLAGNNINTGPTEVRNGRLIVSGSLAAPATVSSGAVLELSGSLASAPVTVNSGGTFLVDNGANLSSTAVQVNGLMDVSAAGGYFNLNSASLSGSGVVTGTVMLSSSSVNPGQVGGAGTLVITNGDFTINGGTLAFDLSNDPTNGVNDLLVVNGGLNLSSPATVSINKLNGNLGGGTYKLIKFSGAFTGDLAYLTVSGAGPLDVLQQNGNEIDLVVSPVATLTWTGGAPGNLWDVVTSINWLSNGVAATFTNGEAVVFDNSGATNPVVTVPATVQPVAVVVSSSSNYTFVGVADIGNGAALTKSGSGSLTILNANTYIGGTFVNGGTLKLGDGISLNGSIVGNIANNANLVVANSADQTLSGIISGAGTLFKQGAGILTLNATNLLTGPTIISSGTLALGDYGSACGLLGTGNVTNNSQLLLAEPAAVTISNNITGTGGIDNNSSASVIIAGAISGAGRLTNDYSAGTLYLTASNTYSGGTVINNGTLVVSDQTLHGLGSGNVVINDGTGAIWFSASGANTVANNIQLPSNSTADQFLLPGGIKVRLTGLLTGGAAGQITRFVNLSAGGDNSGEVILDNPANTFTTIPETYFGNLGFTSDGALGNLTNGISVNVGNKVNTQFYNRANDGLRFESNNITLNASRSINLVGNENINVQTFTGTIAGPITGFALNKRGTGTLIVNGPGSLSNLTAVVEGTLVVNNVWTGTNVTVNSGAVLSGTGNINALLQINSGGTLAPASSATGTLTVTSNVVLNTGCTVRMKLDPGTVTCDRVAGVPAITYAGSLVVTNLGGTIALGQSYQLFSAASYTGSFAATNLPALSGLAWNWNPANGTLSVVAGGIATNPTNITATVSGGNLNLSWPADHTGWRLLVQTNNLLAGISSSTNDWGAVAGSTTTNQVSIPIDATKPTEFYRMSYP